MVGVYTGPTHVNVGVEPSTDAFLATYASHPIFRSPFLYLFIGYLLYFWLRLGSKPKLLSKCTQLSDRRLSQVDSLNRKHWPSFFAPVAFLQTVLGFLPKVFIKVYYAKEILTCADGGTIVLDWEATNVSKGSPVLLVLHGWVGGSQDTYVKSLVAHCKAHYKVVVFNRRGCKENRVLTAPAPYQFGGLDDLRSVLSHIRRLYPHQPILACGFSMGANMLVKYLGVEKDRSLISAAVSICNPWNLVDISYHCRDTVKFYNWAMSKSYKEAHCSDGNEEYLRAHGWSSLSALPNDLRQVIFHSHSPAYGFELSELDEYLAENSSCNFVAGVRVPLLCINPENDDLIPLKTVPREKMHNIKNITLCTTQTGGHLGFHDILSTNCFTDQLTLEFLDACLRDGRVRKQVRRSASWIRKIRRNGSMPNISRRSKSSDSLSSTISTKPSLCQRANSVATTATFDDVLGIPRQGYDC